MLKASFSGESGFLDETRRDRIVTTWHEQNPGTIEQRSQANGAIGHVADLISLTSFPLPYSLFPFLLFDLSANSAAIESLV
jgi:hypothetical protein